MKKLQKKYGSESFSGALRIVLLEISYHSAVIVTSYTCSYRHSENSNFLGDPRNPRTSVLSICTPSLGIS